MGHRDGIFATIALALSSVALAGIVYTDAYSQAAQSEASGLHALTEQVQADTSMASGTDLAVARSGTVQR